MFQNPTFFALIPAVQFLFVSAISVVGRERLKPLNHGAATLDTKK